MKFKILRKKTLTIIIVASFIGISITPAFALETKQSIVNYQNKEDCRCKEISNEDFSKVEGLLNSISVLIKILSVLSRHNPEIKEKCEEISNKIPIIDVFNTKLKPNLPSQDTTFICTIIEIIAANFFIIYDISFELFYYFISVNNSFFSVIFGNIRNLSEVCIGVIYMIGMIYDCWYYYP